MFRSILIALAIFTVFVCAEETAPSPKPPPESAAFPVPKPFAPPVSPTRPPNQDFVASLERMRNQPRAGEFSNGNFASPLVDIFSDSPDARAKVSALQTEYEKALVERASRWEGELRELRAQYDARIVAQLPEDRREQASKFADNSRQKWTECNLRDSATRADFLERLRKNPRTPTQAPRQPGTNPAAVPNIPGQPNSEASEWLTGERSKAAKQDELFLKSLRELLTSEEASKFDRHIHARSPGPAPVRPPTAPATASQPAVPSVPSAVNAPSTPALPGTSNEKK